MDTKDSCAKEKGASSDNDWIAVQPPSLVAPSSTAQQDKGPPSFDASQFDIFLRRKRVRTGAGGLKLTSVPSRFLNLSNDFEFAGWGTYTHITFSEADNEIGHSMLQTLRRHQVLGQFTASALAGNDVLGGVFYVLPAVISVANAFSPISLLIATLILYVWRPIMEELGSALPIKGAPYTYFLNVSTKTLALISASLLLLDFAATSVISAATAASYLAGEISLPFPPFVGAIIVLFAFTLVSLAGIKESARIALVVLTLHIVTILLLIIVCCVRLRRNGVNQLRENWIEGQPPSPTDALHQIFNGICLGMLGLTGFETTPAYIARIKPGRFPVVLRNLHIPAIIFNVLLVILVLALLPLKTINQGANVLSMLAQVAAGSWLRKWIVFDAIVVLCGGVLTGIISACELLEQLSHDRVIPQAFLNVLPYTGSPYVSIAFFIGLSGMLYATAGASLSILSKMFSLTWLTVMALFPLSLLLLRFNRNRLPREPQTPLSIIFIALAISAIIMAGNIAVDPTTAGYFAPYFIGILLIFSATQNKTHLLRCMVWLYDQYPFLHTWKMTRTCGTMLTQTMQRLKRQPICILVKNDEIDNLLRMTLYVRKNEETSCLKIVHFLEEETGIPSELEANAKILDEAFPEITIDLVIVHATFEPSRVAALASRFQIPTSLMFMGCLSDKSPYSVAEFGTRIIGL